MARRAKKYDGHEVTASIGLFSVLKGDCGIDMDVKTKSGAVVGHCKITQGGISWTRKHGRKDSANTTISKRWSEVSKLFE